jgi:hypothetical protein
MNGIFCRVPASFNKGFSRMPVNSAAAKTVKSGGGAG